MWNDTLRKLMTRNLRLLSRSCMAGGLSMGLFTAGYVLERVSTDPYWLAVVLVAGIVIPVLFGLCIKARMPKYPQTPLEAHQDEVVRAIIAEWGPAIHWLRETGRRAQG